MELNMSWTGAGGWVGHWKARLRCTRSVTSRMPQLGWWQTQLLWAIQWFLLPSAIKECPSLPVYLAWPWLHTWRRYAFFGPRWWEGLCCFVLHLYLVYRANHWFEFFIVVKNLSVMGYNCLKQLKTTVLALLTLSDVVRGGQKGKKWECFQKFSSRRAHFPRGLMDKALDFDTKGP